MDSTQIKKNLGFLNEELKNLDIHGQMLLVGGAVMVTHVKNRPATEDIDVSIIASTAQMYTLVVAAIAAVAKKKHLPHQWLNDDVSIVTDQVGRPRHMEPWLRLSHLIVYVPDWQYMLSLKVFSGRSQDYEDIQALGRLLKVSTQQQCWAIVDSYIPSRLRDQPVRVRMENAIKHCFNA